MYIDYHLTTIINHPDITLLLSEPDIKAMHGLLKTIKNHYFLTDGQSCFCLALLERNKEKLMTIIPELSDDLNAPTWSKNLRQIEIIKQMNIVDGYIDIQSNYSIEFRHIMQSLNKTIEIMQIDSIGRNYKVSLTEQSIVILVEKLQPLNFDISEEIIKYYNTITSWNFKDVLDNFNIKNITDETTKQLIIDDIGSNTPSDSLIVNDRRMRYQYTNDARYNSGLVNEPVTLTQIIANRTTTKVWVENTQHSLYDVIKSLVELNRLPILFVFDNNNEKTSIDQLKNLSQALELNNITDNIGIYFRLKNTEQGKPFNEIIADKKYNTMLDKTTKIAGIEFSNLPKFFLKTDWQPMTVLSFNNGLRSNRPAIYAKRCDLIITYSSHKPLIESARII